MESKARDLEAWVVTSEHFGPGKPELVEILNPRLNAENVRRLVELIYQKDASTIEKINWRLRRKSCPYPAEFVQIEGVPFSYEISCGHNPRLRARPATLHIAQDNTVTYTDKFNLAEVRAIQRRRKKE
jgi:hypothetical protein